MTKRSTETVLRAEVERAARDELRAKDAVETAAAAARAAANRLDEARVAEGVLRNARYRAEKALTAFLGEGELGILVDQAKDRASKDGTHDPADLATSTEICPIGCDSGERLELGTDWQAEVASGTAIPIVGCGNPWHYTVDGQPLSGEAVDALPAVVEAEAQKAK
jgi:hypothetical protein